MGVIAIKGELLLNLLRPAHITNVMPFFHGFRGVAPTTKTMTSGSSCAPTTRSNGLVTALRDVVYRV